MNKLFLRRKKLVLTFGILIMLITVPISLLGEESIDRDDIVFLIARMLSPDLSWLAMTK